MAPLSGLSNLLEKRLARLKAGAGNGLARDQDDESLAMLSIGLRKLLHAIAEGSFREDLLYRLEGLVIEVPPLRRRREDIAGLAADFLREAKRQSPRAVAERFSASATKLLLDYEWPGNVRELERVVSRAVLLARSEEIGVDDFPATITEPAAAAKQDFGSTVIAVRELQRLYAAWALERLGGRKMLTCEKLGIDAKTLAKWLSADHE